MNIIITGVAGFLGSSLAEYCVDKGHNVVGFDNFSRGSLSNLDALVQHDQFTLVEGDLTDPGLGASFYEQAELCFHLAAINGTKFFHERALDVISTNITMTMNVVKHCMKTATRLVFSSSPEAFGLVEHMPLEDTNDSRFPAAHEHQRFSYGATKYVEELAMHHAHRQQLDVRIVRPFNVYGPRLRGKEDGQVIGRFLNLLFNQQSIELHYEGKHTRSFTYIDDAVEGIYLAGILDSSCKDGQTLSGLSFNIGSNDEYTMSDLAHLLIDICNEEGIELPKSPIRVLDTGHPGDSLRRSCNPQAAFEHLQWSADTSLVEGLHRTVQGLK